MLYSFTKKMLYSLKQLLKEKFSTKWNCSVLYFMAKLFYTIEERQAVYKVYKPQVRLLVYVTLMVLLQQLEANLAKVWASTKTTAGTTKTITCKSKFPCHLLDEFNSKPTKQLGTAVYDNFVPFSKKLILKKTSCTTLTEYNNFFFLVHHSRFQVATQVPHKY